MLIALSMIGILTLATGYLLLFQFPRFKQLSQKMNRPIFSEVWICDHRVALGVLLMGLTVLLFAGVYFILKMS